MKLMEPPLYQVQERTSKAGAKLMPMIAGALRMQVQRVRHQ
jgi:hypothetical protein